MRYVIFICFGPERLLVDAVYIIRLLFIKRKATIVKLYTVLIMSASSVLYFVLVWIPLPSEYGSLNEKWRSRSRSHSTQKL